MSQALALLGLTVIWGGGALIAIAVPGGRHDAVTLPEVAWQPIEL